MKHAQYLPVGVVMEVEMWAFAHGAVRRVSLPEGVPASLNAAFEFGQNDFATEADIAQGLPSVSVGDIIRLGGTRHVVMPTGFKEVADSFIPPVDDRGGFYAYGLERR